MLPVVFIIMAVMDYAAWAIFNAMAGGDAIWYMLGLLFFEFVALLGMARAVAEG